MDYRLQIPLVICFLSAMGIMVMLAYVVRDATRETEEMARSYQKLRECVTDMAKKLEKYEKMLAQRDDNKKSNH